MSRTTCYDFCFITYLYKVNLSTFKNFKEIKKTLKKKKKMFSHPFHFDQVSPSGISRKKIEKLCGT